MSTWDMSTWKNQLLLVFGIVVATLTGNGGVLADFSFAVIADPHIDGDPDHEAKFRTAVAAVIDTKGIRNTAGIPYVPIIGDNEVQAGCEAEFDTVFSPQYTYLSTAAGIENWQKASVPINSMYLQNFSFDYKQCHFTCADFASRIPGDEGGELHDFEGGTWRWFKSDIENAPTLKGENINVITHIGMLDLVEKYLFSSSELNTIKGFIQPYKDNVDSNYAGHIHQNFTWNVPTLFPYYTVRVIDETWHDIWVKAIALEDAVRRRNLSHCL